MGEVYKARDTRLGREVALKIPPADFAQDAERRARFDLEARAASALNHPNIVTVHNIGEEGGVSFIVTELVEGESLRALIERGPVLARKLIDIAAQLGDGLLRYDRSSETNPRAKSIWRNLGRPDSQR